jgi:hypothetical protein
MTPVICQPVGIEDRVKTEEANFPDLKVKNDCLFEKCG